MRLPPLYRFALLPFALVSVLPLWGQPAHGATAPPPITVRIPTEKHVDPELTDALVNGYLAQISGRLAHEAGIEPAPPVLLTRSADIRANVLPGDAIVLTAGMVLRAQTEGELAGILAHELAHIWLAHARDPNGKLLPNVVPVWPDCVLAYLNIPPQFRNNRRVEENSRDELAAQYLAAAGYDPTEMTGFLLKLRYERAGLADVFALDDLLAIENAPANAPAAGHPAIVDTTKFREIQTHLAALMKDAMKDVVKEKPVSPAAQPASTPTPAR
jgi:hypothetical protein